jgi:hypothetical protein
MRLLGLFLAVALLAWAQDIAGEWHGWIEIKNDAPLRLALHVAPGARIRATIDSVDEGGTGLPVEGLVISGAKVRFEMNGVGAVYEGTVAEDSSRIRGVWRQDGGVWPLDWERGEDPASLTQAIDPQTARKQGQICTQWLYSGDLSDLWTKLGPVMRQALVSETGLRELRDNMLQQWGPEVILISESVETNGALQVYRRLAHFAKQEGNVEVQFAFDPRGAAATFHVGLARQQ